MNVVIFGGTSAIAIACARRWVGEGANVFLVARNPAKLEAITQDLTVRKAADRIVAGTPADLADLAGHARLFDMAHAAIGPIDTVLLAHGTLPDQDACEGSVDLVVDAFNTNALSVIALATRAAMVLEANGGGTLAAIGSVAGDRGRGSNYVYGAAKGAVSLYLGGLRNRYAKRGVHVLTIKPGFVDTPMTAHIADKGFLWAQPGRVGDLIVKAVAQRKNVIYVPGFWRAIMAVITHIPEPIFKRMSL